jgi:hypothetical protein
MTLSTTTLSIMILSIVTLSIMDVMETLRIKPDCEKGELLLPLPAIIRVPQKKFA